MSFPYRSTKNIVILVALVGVILLSACNGPAQAENPGEPEVLTPTEEEMNQSAEIQDQPVNEDLMIVSHERARDIAVNYLVGKYALEIPGEWFSENQTPQGLLGASNFLYSSGAWVVQVTAPVVAPEHLVYTLTIDHIASGTHWEGEVDAWGNLHETITSEPFEVLSALDARDAVVAYIMANYGWEATGEWTEQSVIPLENAGIRQIFTSGPWVVQIDHYAAAPIVPEYHLIADHLKLIARWEGQIRADGKIVEEAYISN